MVTKLESETGFDADPRSRPDQDDDSFRHAWTRYRTLLDDEPDDDDVSWDLGPEESPYSDDVPGTPPPHVKD